MCQCLLVHVCSICSSFFVGVAEAIIGWLNCDVLSVFFSVFSIFCLKQISSLVIILVCNTKETTFLLLILVKCASKK